MTTVLVLGASRGIGLEFVRQYLQDQARVIATARDDAGLERLQALGARTLRLDVTDPASMGSLSRRLEGEKIDLALYVAGVFSTEAACHFPGVADFNRVMHANVMGAMHAITEVAPLVAAARGRFVFLSSDMARISSVGSSNSWVYRASKAALNMTVASAQHEYPDAVMVAISPGWVRTEMGGAYAPLAVEDSVIAMRKTIGRLSDKHKGAFVNYDGRPYKSW